MLSNKFKYLLISSGLSLMLCACQQQSPPPTTDSSTDNSTSNSADITATPTTTTECTLTMGYDSWEPYHFTTADNAVRGIDVELVQALATEANCTVDFIEGQWVDLLTQLKAGDIDVLAGATLIAERESYAWFSTPYRSEEFELYSTTDAELPAQEFGTLLGQGFRIGLTDGYIYGESISSSQNDSFYADQFVYASIAEMNFTNLADGSIDGFLADPFVTAAIIRRNGWHDQVRATGLMISNMPVSLMFSRATTTQAQLITFNNALAKIKQTGRDQEVFKRYLGIDG